MWREKGLGVITRTSQTWPGVTTVFELGRNMYPGRSDRINPARTSVGPHLSFFKSPTHLLMENEMICGNLRQSNHHAETLTLYCA